MPGSAMQTIYKKHRFSSIRSKLSFAITLILIPIVILLSLISYRNAHILLKNRAFKQVESVRGIKQQQIEDQIHNYKRSLRLLTNELNLLATQSGISQTTFRDQAQELIFQAKLQNPEISHIFLISQEAVESAKPLEVNIRNYLAQNPALTNNSEHRNALVYEEQLLLVDEIYSPEPSLITALINLDAIQKIVEDYAGLESSGVSLLVKKEGDKIKILNSQPPASETNQADLVVVENLSQTPSALATKNHSGTALTNDYRGIEVISAYGGLSVKDLGLVVKINSQEVFSLLKPMKMELIGVSGLTILLFILVAYLVSRSITEPLKKLQKGAEEIGKGKWNYELDINTGDEVEHLAQEFRRMAIELGGLYGKLEERVEVRTAELEKEKEVSEHLADDLKKFLQAVENASDQIIITDVDGKIVYANEAMATNTGYSRIEVIGQKPGKLLWGGQMDDKFYKHMWKTIKTKKQRWQGEVKNKKKNGKHYIASLSISPILNINGEVKYYVGIERDVTRERVIDRMKTEFISVASHQLRTPLSAVRWFAEMLISGDAGKLNNEQEEYVQQIYDSNDRMIELVNALLNVSRIEEGRIAIEPKPTDLDKLVDQVIAELTPKIKEKKLKIIISKHKKLPKISIDPKLVRQVYANLIANAVKYTPEKGEITILISKKGDEIISQIQDTGYGIPEDQQARVFTKFFRGDNIRTDIPEGTGLGLYIVRSVIQSSGGKIWFESKENQGTTFWFTLPISGTPPKQGERTLEDAYL